ncbi:MAG: hypothetical protein QNK23_06640 [Crocinitomicaceae bacterium]|nr:hypothetical protein [Crocinitomicaceae bacterium]
MKKLIRNSVILCLLFVSISFNFVRATFDEGVAAYDDKEYVLSVEKFKEVIAETPNDVAAYYNLGLAQMADENFGEALWAFEKVLKFNPNDGEALENSGLCFAELEQMEEWEPATGSFLANVYSLSSNAWSILSISLSVLLFLVVILFKKLHSLSVKRLLFICGVFLTLFVVASVLAAYGSKKYSQETNFAIITQKEIPTFSEAGTTTQMNLSEGTRVEVLDKDSAEYIRVQTYPGDEHLVKFEDLAFI